MDSVLAEIQFDDPALEERAQRGDVDVAEGEIDIAVTAQVPEHVAEHADIEALSTSGPLIKQFCCGEPSCQHVDVDEERAAARSNNAMTLRPRVRPVRMSARCSRSRVSQVRSPEEIDEQVPGSVDEQPTEGACVLRLVDPSSPARQLLRATDPEPAPHRQHQGG